MNKEQGEKKSNIRHEMSTSNDNNDDSTDENDTLTRVHGTVMVIAWIIFASTGILFARYGRLLHIDGRIEFLGELLWFQIHRLTLSIAAIATLIGFFLILVQKQGQWVDKEDARIYAHSILGIIVICCTELQVWFAMYRCNPNNRFRFIFNWIHQYTGLLAFILSIPTIFLVISTLENFRRGLIIILSLWTGWIILIVLIFEIYEYHYKKTNNRSYEISNNTYPTENIDYDRTQNSNLEYYNRIKKILFFIHVIIAIALTISIIVLIWLQDNM